MKADSKYFKIFRGTALILERNNITILYIIYIAVFLYRNEDVKKLCLIKLIV